MAEFKVNDIVRVTDVENRLSGSLGEVRELRYDSAYVEFNDRNGATQCGRILGFSEIEWVYTPSDPEAIYTAIDVAGAVLEAYGWANSEHYDTIHDMVVDGVLIGRGKVDISELG